MGHAMKAQKTVTKTQMYFQQKRKCRINKTATCNSKSATSSVSVIYRIKTRSKKTLRRKAISNAPNVAELVKLAARIVCMEWLSCIGCCRTLLRTWRPQVRCKITPGVNVVINDVISKLPAAIVSRNGRHYSLVNAVPTSSEGNNDSPKNTNRCEIAEFLSMVFWHTKGLNSAPPKLAKVETTTTALSIWGNSWNCMRGHFLSQW